MIVPQLRKEKQNKKLRLIGFEVSNYVWHVGLEDNLNLGSQNNSLLIII